MLAPRPVPLSSREADLAVEALDNAREEPLTEAEREQFEQAMANPDPGVSTADLLERLRPKA